MTYFLTDHLGSIVGVTDATGSLTAETRYLPFGETRSDVGTISETQYGYTDQEGISYIKLMDYRSRFYSPELGRFVSPDTIVPNIYSSQAYNRYGYVNNDPVNHTDPTGHMCDEEGNCYGTYMILPGQTKDFNPIMKTKVIDPKDLKTSEAGIRAIKDAEGGNNRMYNDGGYSDNCTIGFGTLIHYGSCDYNEDIYSKGRESDGITHYYVYITLLSKEIEVEKGHNDQGNYY